MTMRLKLYLSVVIASGAVLLGASLWNWTSPNPNLYLMYLVLSVLASALKLRLPGIPGTYSLNFLFVLAGIAYFTLPETLLAGCAGALAQTLWNTKKRPTAVQIAFNVANLALSISVCFGVVHLALAGVLHSYRPVALAVATFLYFVTNTVLVSGVLSLLEGKALPEVCQQWYVWSFPYYLVGAVLVGQLPALGGAMTPEIWWFILPLLYLIHFFYGLANGPRREGDSGQKSDSRPTLSLGAMVYLNAVIAGGLVVVIVAAAHWHSDNLLRLVVYLSAAALTAMCKVRLPGTTETISVSFVVLLASVAELSLPEAVLIAAIETAVQCVWNAQRRPRPVQVFFSMAAVVLSTAMAYLGSRLAPTLGITGSLPAMLGLATALMYFSNTILVSAAVSAAEGHDLLTVWQRCYFWSFPYYMVGAAASGLMITTARTAGWQPSLLVLPVMVLVYVSYRLHVGRTVPQQTVSG